MRFEPKTDRPSQIGPSDNPAWSRYCEVVNLWSEHRIAVRKAPKPMANFVSLSGRSCLAGLAQVFVQRPETFSRETHRIPMDPHGFPKRSFAHGLSWLIMSYLDGASSLIHWYLKRKVVAAVLPDIYHAPTWQDPVEEVSSKPILNFFGVAHELSRPNNTFHHRPRPKRAPHRGHGMRTSTDVVKPGKN